MAKKRTDPESGWNCCYSIEPDFDEMTERECLGICERQHLPDLFTFETVLNPPDWQTLYKIGVTNIPPPKLYGQEETQPS